MPIATERLACDMWCAACRYPLTKLADARRCPECGRHFDPGDPRTYLPAPAPQWVTDRLNRTTRHTDRWRAVSLGLFVPALLLLPGSGLWIIAGLVFTADTFLRYGLAEWLNRLLAKVYAVPYTSEHRRRWLCVAALLVIPAAMLGLPAHLLLRLERSAIERFCYQVNCVEPFGTHRTGIARVGILLVHYDNRPTGVEIEVGSFVTGHYEPPPQSNPGSSRGAFGAEVHPLDFSREQAHLQLFPHLY